MEINNINLPEEVKQNSFFGKYSLLIIILATVLVMIGGLYAYASYVERNSVESVIATKVNQQTPFPVVRSVSITPVSSLTKVPTPTTTSYLTPKQVTDQYSGGGCGTKLSWEGTVVNVTGFVDYPHADFRTFQFASNFHLDTDQAMVGQGRYYDSIIIAVSENLINQAFFDKLASLHNENVNVKITLTAQDFPVNGNCKRSLVGELSSDDIAKI